MGLLAVENHAWRPLAHHIGSVRNAWRVSGTTRRAMSFHSASSSARS